MRISDWSSDVCSSDLDDELYLAGQLLPRRFERKAIGFAEAFEHLHIVRRGRVRFRPRHHRTLLQAQRMVGDDEFGVEFEPFAKPVARRAGALRRVAAEQSRLDLGDGDTRNGTGEIFGEDDAVGRYPADRKSTR